MRFVSSHFSKAKGMVTVRLISMRGAQKTSLKWTAVKGTGLTGLSVLVAGCGWLTADCFCRAVEVIAPKHTAAIPMMNHFLPTFICTPQIQGTVGCPTCGGLIIEAFRRSQAA